MQFLLPNNAESKRLTSISCLSPLTNKFLVFFLTMPQQRKLRCYRSPTGVRQPKCRLITSFMCLPCQRALSFHYKIKAANSAYRIRRRRQAAELNRHLKVEAYSDLCATNMTLEGELEQHNRTLEEWNNARRDLSVHIIAKEEEVIRQRGQVAADLALELLRCPRSGLAQLQQLMQSSVTAVMSPASSAFIASGFTDVIPSVYCID